MIFAGKLKHRVTLQRLANASPDKTSSGEPDDAWADVATVYASIEPLNGRELFAAQEHHAETTTRIRMRWRSGVDAKMRATHGGTTYNILSVIDPEKGGTELHLMCSTGLQEE